MRTLTISIFMTIALGGISSAQGLGSDDPVPSHTITVQEAAKGVKGSGPFTAKIDIEQSGKALGSFSCELFDKQTPMTVANFIGLARGTRPFKDVKSGTWEKRPFFDGLTFHRVIATFMIQGGDPAGNGSGNPGYKFANENLPELTFDKPGMLAMANAGRDTNGSQFFITEDPQPRLNGGYTIFGKCTPVELVKTIARVAKGPMDRPTEPVIMKKVTITGGGGKKAK